MRALLSTPLLVGFAWLGAAGSAASRAPDYTSDVVEFLDHLGALRGGDESARESLLIAGRRLCDEHDRCDSLEVARYYVGLPQEVRRMGRADEERYLALRARVQEAGRRRLAGWSWERERSGITGGLRELTDEILDRAGVRDVIPAAQALGLLARIEIESAENSNLAASEREATRRAGENASRRSLELFESCGFVTPRLEPRWILGRALALAGDTWRARAQFETCLAEARATSRLDFQEHALLSLAALARSLGDVIEERRFLAELALARPPSESWLLTRNYSDRLLQEDHAPEAMAFLERNRPDDSAPLEQVAQWHQLMAMAALRIGDADAVHVHLDAQGSSAKSEDTILSRARLDVLEEDYEAVIEGLSEPAITEAFGEKGLVEVHTLLGEAFLRLGDLEAAEDELRWSLGFGDRRTRRSDRSGSPPGGPGDPGETGARANLIGEVVGLHTVSLLAETLVLGGAPIEAARVMEEYQSRSLRGGIPLEREHILNWARANELGLVTWVVGADRSVAVYVDPRGEGFGHVVPHGRSAIREAVRRLREATLTNDPLRMSSLSIDVLRELFPLEARARIAESSDEARRLLLLVHGPLEELPFELLILDGSGLDENVTTLVLPGLPAPEPGAEPDWRELTDWQLLGDPVATGGDDLLGLPRLPAAREELLSISRFYPRSRLAVGESFDRRAVADALRGSSPLHVATHLAHGCECPEGRRSRLALELSAGEAFCSHDIRAIGPRLPLVVLAACETALGEFLDSDGLQSLARTFLESGTRNLVVTLWPVRDRVARSFSIAFHEGLAGGMSPSRATRAARASLRATGLEPADWAAFRLVGRD